ncbi:MAG: tRNA lysidine(34) synthetase TilS [Caulobacteraceae bacterium]
MPEGDFVVNLVETVKATINKYNMLQKGDRIVVGVSGGPDSLCLLHILKTLSNECGYELYAAHLNHKFRGKDADEDAAFVERTCKEWGIPAWVEAFDVPAYIVETGLSPEEAGREIRYKLFNEMCDRVGANKIAVAQNLNDHIETILMRFMRGSGIDGLKGIEPVRDNIVRPLIETDRRKIEEYCSELKLNPRIDKTNLEPIYYRNKVRLELIPYMEKNFNPNIKQALARFSNLIKDENEFLEQEAGKAFDTVAESEAGRIIIDTGKTKGMHIALKRRLVRIAVENLSNTLNGFEFKHFEGIVDLMDKSTGAAVMLPQKIKAYVSYDKLILAKDIEKADKKCYYKLKYDYDNNIETENGRIIIARKKSNDIERITKEKDRIFIDGSKIREGLVLRNREPGDMFSPIGLKGSKKLKDYFIDEKVPREQRDEIELIADGNEVVWIVGGRISEKYKITDRTSDVIIIKYLRRSYNG